MDKVIYILLLIFSFSSTFSRGLRYMSYAAILLYVLCDLIKNKMNIFKEMYLKNKLFYNSIIIFYFTILLNIFVHKKYEQIDRYYVDVFFQIFILILSFNYLNLKKAKVNNLFIAFLLSGTLECIYSLYQSIHLNMSRTTGFLDVMQLASLINFVIVYSLIYLLYGNLKKNIKFLLILVFLISITSLLLNRSRGAWLSIIVTLGICFMVKGFKDFFKYICVLVTFAIVLHSSPNNFIKDKFRSIKDKNNMSNVTRINFFKGGLKIYKENLIFGVGYGKFKENYDKPEYYSGPLDSPVTLNTHNNLVQIASESGTVGLIGYLVLIIGILTVLMKNYLEEQDKNTKLFYLGGLGIFFVYNLQGLTENNLLSSDLVWMYWFLIILNVFYKKDEKLEKLKIKK